MNRGISIGEFQHRLSEIEEKHGRIAKSQFVIANWIVKAKWFELAAIRHGNKRMLEIIHIKKHSAINELIKSGLCDINFKEYETILELELEGMKLIIIVPSVCSMDSGVERSKILLDGIEYKDKRKFKLDFILDNIEKSRLKLIDKMKEI